MSNRGKPSRLRRVLSVALAPFACSSRLRQPCALAPCRVRSLPLCFPVRNRAPRSCAVLARPVRRSLARHDCRAVSSGQPCAVTISGQPFTRNWQQGQAAPIAPRPVGCLCAVLIEQAAPIAATLRPCAVPVARPDCRAVSSGQPCAVTISRRTVAPVLIGQPAPIAAPSCRLPFAVRLLVPTSATVRPCAVPRPFLALVLSRSQPCAALLCRSRSSCAPCRLPQPFTRNEQQGQAVPVAPRPVGCPCAVRLLVRLPRRLVRATVRRHDLAATLHPE